MSEKNPSVDSQARFKELANGYQPKLSPKLAELLPFKKQIQELRSRKASYDDIRLLLTDVNITVSLDTVHRFCRKVIGQPVVRPYKTRAPRNPSANISPIQQPTEKIGGTLPEQRDQRERYAGPWSKRKRGPRIADSKNL